MNTIIWVHGDALSPQNPALLAVSDAPALFVFDLELLADYDLSFKRLVFLYECLLEMPVVIRKGDVIEELRQFAQEHQANRVLTTATPSPRFALLLAKLQKHVEVDILEPVPLVEDRPYDLARFSRYWRQAQKTVRIPSVAETT